MRRRSKGCGSPLPSSLQVYVPAEWAAPEDWFAAWDVWASAWHDEHPDAEDQHLLTWWLEAAQTAPDVPFDGSEV